MANVTPNGEAIRVQMARNQITQENLGGKAEVDPKTIRRMLRGERVRDIKLQDVATVLGVPLEEIVTNEGDDSNAGGTTIAEDVPRALPIFRTIELKNVESAREFHFKAREANKFSWRVSIDPDEEVAALVESFLTITRRLVVGLTSTSQDMFDSHDFSDIHRMAGLNKLIQQMSDKGIVVLVNTYVTWDGLAEATSYPTTVIVVEFAESGTASSSYRYEISDDDIPF